MWRVGRPRQPLREVEHSIDAKLRFQRDIGIKRDGV